MHPADKPFHYFETIPSPEAAAIAAAYWGFETRLPPSQHFEHHLWPDGCISIGGAVVGGRVTATFLVGPTLRAHRTTVEHGARYFGIKFWPEAGGAALGLEPQTLRDVISLAEPHLGPIVSSFAATLAGIPGCDVSRLKSGMDRWIRDCVLARGMPPIDPIVRAAVRRVIGCRGGITVAALADEAGLSARQLHRRFVAAVGLSPKDFTRIRRVRSAIAELLEGGQTWSRVAADLGYADQSHLIRDMAEVTGLTPGVLSERIRLIEHTAVTP